MEANVRIDKGIKRGPRPKLSRDTKTGRLLPAVSIEHRQAIMADALEALKRGETTDSIAKRHNVSGRTVRHWLLSEESANDARVEFLTGKLVECAEDIERSKAPLPLARAREAFRSWSWIAERRLSRMYGVKQELTVTTMPQLHVHVNAVQPIDTQVIDAMPILPGVDGGDAPLP